MRDTLARLLLSPLLIAQALKVRHIAQSLPEAAGPRSGCCGTGPRLRLAIIGDSSAAGVGVAQQSQALAGQLTQALGSDFTVSWHLDALTGATTKSTLARLVNAAPKPLDVIIIALGVNDVTRLVPRHIWLQQQRDLRARLHALYRPKHIYLSGMPPIAHFPLLPEPLRWTLGRHANRLKNAMIADLARVHDTTYMPFSVPLDRGLMASDGFHPSAALYALWANEMASRIKSDWPHFKSPSDGLR